LLCPSVPVVEGAAGREHDPVQGVSGQRLPAGESGCELVSRRHLPWQLGETAHLLGIVRRFDLFDGPHDPASKSGAVEFETLEQVAQVVDDPTWIESPGGTKQFCRLRRVVAPGRPPVEGRVVHHAHGSEAGVQHVLGRELFPRAGGGHRAFGAASGFRHVGQAPLALRYP
jgi:hypothetical protein